MFTCNIIIPTYKMFVLTCDFHNVTSQHRDISKLHKSHVNIIILHVNIIIFPACRGKEVWHHTIQCFQQNLNMLARSPVAQCRKSKVLIVTIAAIIGENYERCIFPILTVKCSTVLFTVTSPYQYLIHFWSFVMNLQSYLWSMFHISEMLISGESYYIFCHWTRNHIISWNLNVSSSNGTLIRLYILITL